MVESFPTDYVLEVLNLSGAHNPMKITMYQDYPDIEGGRSVAWYQ